MTWIEYEQCLIDATPQLADGSARMTLTVAEFLLRLRRAYDAGRQDVSASVSEGPGDGRDLLSEMFPWLGPRVKRQRKADRSGIK